PVTVVSSQLNWKGDVSNNWSTQGRWGIPNSQNTALPTSNDDTLVNNSGSTKSYTITVNGAGDVAHSLTITDPDAIVLDTTGGDLNLGTGSGGLTIANGAFELWGGSLEAGTIYIQSNGSTSGTLSTEGNYTLGETIWNAGTVEINS